MKCINSAFNSSTGRFVLFLFTLAVGMSASALISLKSSSTNAVSNDTKQIAEILEGQLAQKEDIVSERIEFKPEVVQAEVIDFRKNGRVIVESVEEIGRFPQMVFRAEKTGEVLLRSSIEDVDKLLIPEKDGLSNQPDLRFHTIKSGDFSGPIIMSVGIYHGGSDNAYYLTLFGEVDGKIRRLNDMPITTSIQGGYYLGSLNTQFGYGLAVWSFIWGEGEARDSRHHYKIEVYQLQNGEFKRTFNRVTKRTYDEGEVVNSLLEFGIKAEDQRKEIPEIKESLP